MRFEKKKIGDDKRFCFTRYLRRGAPQWQKPRREGGGGGLLVETGVSTGSHATAGWGRWRQSSRDRHAVKERAHATEQGRWEARRSAPAAVLHVAIGVLHEIEEARCRRGNAGGLRVEQAAGGDRQHRSNEFHALGQASGDAQGRATAHLGAKQGQSSVASKRGVWAAARGKHEP